MNTVAERNVRETADSLCEIRDLDASAVLSPNELELIAGGQAVTNSF